MVIAVAAKRAHERIGRLELDDAVTRTVLTK